MCETQGMEIDFLVLGVWWNDDYEMVSVVIHFGIFVLSSALHLTIHFLSCVRS